MAEEVITVVVTQESIDHVFDQALLMELYRRRTDGNLDSNYKRRVPNSLAEVEKVIEKLPAHLQGVTVLYFKQRWTALSDKSESEGGLPSGRRGLPSREEPLLLAQKVKKWGDKMGLYPDPRESPEYAEWAAGVKRRKDYRCAGCGNFGLGLDLDLHFYTTERPEPGDEISFPDTAVSIVCSPVTTGRACRALMEVAREAAGVAVREDGKLF